MKLCAACVICYVNVLLKLFPITCTMVTIVANECVMEARNSVNIFFIFRHSQN